MCTDMDVYLSAYNANWLTLLFHLMALILLKGHPALQNRDGPWFTVLIFCWGSFIPIALYSEEHIFKVLLCASMVTKLSLSLFSSLYLRGQNIFSILFSYFFNWCGYIMEKRIPWVWHLASSHPVLPFIMDLTLTEALDTSQLERLGRGNGVVSSVWLWWARGSAARKWQVAGRWHHGSFQSHAEPDSPCLSLWLAEQQRVTMACKY